MRSLSQIAAQDLGLEESPRGSNRGPDLQKFFKADDLDVDGRTDGYAWCAAAVSYWVQQWIKEHSSSLRGPRIAGVALFPKWAASQGLSSRIGSPLPNDIVIFTYSHIAIVESVSGNGFTSIEGNSNNDGSREGYEVVRHNHKFADAKLFITLR